MRRDGHAQKCRVRLPQRATVRAKTQAQATNSRFLSAGMCAIRKALQTSERNTAAHESGNPKRARCRGDGTRISEDKTAVFLTPLLDAPCKASAPSVAPPVRVPSCSPLLATASIVVFDEAVGNFEGTLAPDTADILGHLSKTPSRQTALVSATMPSALVVFSRTGLRANPEVVRVHTHHALLAICLPRLSLFVLATKRMLLHWLCSLKCSKPTCLLRFSMQHTVPCNTSFRLRSRFLVLVNAVVNFESRPRNRLKLHS